MSTFWLPKHFDWKNPDYGPVFARRLEALSRIRKNPDMLPDLLSYYRENPAQFIHDWGVTVDPRNVSRGIPAVVPFMLFDRQVEMIDAVLHKWRGNDDLLIEKSRDVGASWVLMALSCTLCLYNTGVSIGWGSRKEELVDRAGSPKALLWKGREFIKRLPGEFRGDWDEKDSPFMRINFKGTESFISGEAGDGIGRGDRTSLFFVDESAFIDRAELVDFSLSATTNCRIDLSSVNGMNNPFAQKRHSGRVDVFRFEWKDDPRKDGVWYQKQLEKFGPVVVAQEIDLDYSGSVEGILIPNVWVKACVDAHVRLGITPSGKKRAALDVADGGVDKNALAGCHGVLLNHLDEWSGQGEDIYKTTERAIEFCAKRGYERLQYDGDGLGAGVRGDARVINAKRQAAGLLQIPITAFRGSSGVDNPNKCDIVGLPNIDAFSGKKAQSWWALRCRIERTFRWVVEGTPCDPDEILSISSALPNYRQLCMELSQPTYDTNGAGKIVIDKSPSGMKSPNLADAVMILFGNARNAPMVITSSALDRFKRR